ncbi:PTS sugar transporter subunit IIA [Brachyspira sp.]|uniref:PTS sugar transporter subunit IIA n=1 Tax=Brachyspira sp. TaxID=1977261 RepID=UPI0026157657|nr:PTS sugar transporter subunit IIA [Brachyspira sp.]
MLRDMLYGKIQIKDSIEDWEEVLRIASQPLLDAKNIEPRYVDSIINDVYKNGPYIVITDGVAIAHSSPKNGVIKTSISLLKVKEGVNFYQTDKKVYLFFAFAAEDFDSHQDSIAELATFLDNEDLLKSMIEEDLTEEEILNLFN